MVICNYGTLVLTQFRLNNLVLPPHNPTHYILEKTNFNFRYVRLCDSDIPIEKWQNYLQKVEILITADLGLHCTLFGVSRLKLVDTVGI